MELTVRRVQKPSLKEVAVLCPALPNSRALSVIPLPWCTFQSAFPFCFRVFPILSPRGKFYFHFIDRGWEAQIKNGKGRM